MKKICLCLSVMIFMLSLFGCEGLKASDTINDSMIDSDTDNSENDTENEPDEVLSNEPAYFETEVCMRDYFGFGFVRNGFSEDGRILISLYGDRYDNFFVSKKTEYEYDDNGRLERANLFVINTYDTLLFFCVAL